MNTVYTTSDQEPETLEHIKLSRQSESALLHQKDGSKTPSKEITSSSERRKFLSHQQTRSSTLFPTTYISGDFSNPFIDFNTFSVTLPYVGLKVDVLKYWVRGDKRQPLRYVCRLRPKDNEEEVVFFVVLFELVGDGLVVHNETMEAGREGNRSGRASPALEVHDEKIQVDKVEEHFGDAMGVD
jgi:Protein of unknown function (DUF1769)